MADAFSFLKNIPLFAELPDPDLKQLCDAVQEIHLAAGETLFDEGSPGEKAYVIKEGQIEIFKISAGRTVQLAIRQPGEVIGEMALLESAPRAASGRALADSLLLAIDRQDMDRLLDTHPSIARNLLHTVTARLRSTELLLNQSEKMAQLGTLTAGIAHELNNPAAATRRGAEQLRAVFGQIRRRQSRLLRLGLTPAEIEALVAAESQLLETDRCLDLSPMDRSDRQTEIEEWLEDHGVADAWELAPQLVALGIAPGRLDDLAGHFPADRLPAVLEWLGVVGGGSGLLDEIAQGAARISEIVKALKSYVYLDQGPVQEIDVHEGLENTLIILGHKLKAGVQVQREYDPHLPRIQAYGGELNQVWTNLIDNAIDAMEGKGLLRIHTSQQDDRVVVEIEDDGPGIPPEVQARLFSPFFTTKPLGKGTGLGLSISYNIVQKHQGEISFSSLTGQTRFVVRLPQHLSHPPDWQIVPGAAEESAG